MKITVNEQSGYKVFSIEGRIDVTTSVNLESETDKWIKEGNEKIVFNCSEVNYISSSGLRVFLQTQKTLMRLGGTFKVCSMKPEIEEIFKVTGLLQLFDIYETVEAALNS
jgi:anti-anti-sigma factor